MFGLPRLPKPLDPFNSALLLTAKQLRDLTEKDYFKRDPVGTLKRHAQILEDVAMGK